MVKRNTFIVVCLLLVSLAVSTFAVGQEESASSEESYMRLAWWGNPTRDEKTLGVADLYMEQNPNVTIEPETTGWGGYWDRINTQAAAGSLPDLMQHDYAYMLQFVGRGLLTDLTPYINSGVIDLSKVDDTFISGGKVDGGLYGISLGTNAVCVVFNTDVLDQAGIPDIDTASWTWEDFEEIATEIYEKTGVQTDPFFTTDPKVGFDNMIRQTGKSTFAYDGTSLGFTDPAVLKEFFNIQLRLLESGVMVDPEIAFVQVTPEEGRFAQGKTWCNYLWSNQVVAEQAALMGDAELSIGLLPKIKNASRPGTFLKPSMFFSIPSSAENPDEAAKFINFFVNDIAANDILAAERGIPIPSDVRNHLKDQADETSAKIFEYISLVAKNSSPIDPPDPEHTGEVLTLFRTVTQEVLSGIVTVNDGVEKIMNGANDILAQNK
jgi:multiple sugar transport system substrate-binding protein